MRIFKIKVDIIKITSASPISNRENVPSENILISVSALRVKLLIKPPKIVVYSCDINFKNAGEGIFIFDGETVLQQRIRTLVDLSHWMTYVLANANRFPFQRIFFGMKTFLF